MPAYDCGEPECVECGRAFGPDRSEAIKAYRRRCEAYAELERKTRETVMSCRLLETAKMLKIVPDRTGFAPHDMQWMAYDDDAYDGAPDAGRQIVGYGATGDEAEYAYRCELKMSGIAA